MSSSRKNVPKTYTDDKGKFAEGNPGRPKGARQKLSLAVEALLEGQAEELTQVAIEAALTGDMVALRLCLERIAPPRKDVPVAFCLPKMESAQDAVLGARAVLQAVSDGDLTPMEGASVMNLVENYRRTLEVTELERRITELEAKA